MSLAHRVMIPELMDDPALDAARHDQALQGLARINRWSRSADILWPALAEVCKQNGSLRVLDVATGAGDVPIALCKRARDTGLPIIFEACDRSSDALRHAETSAAAAETDVIRFFQHDVLAHPLPLGAYDVTMCSLFLHHVSEEQLMPFMKNLALAARRLVLVNDLERSRLGFAFAWIGTRVLTRSEIVHVDGPRSVRAALTLDEAIRAAESAGMHRVQGGRRWPCRYLLRWDRR